MTLRAIFAYAAIGWIGAFSPTASSEQAAASPNALEEVLVTGEHPGPGLWEVSKGNHTLWILGTHAPLPKRLVWRSQEVEWVITESQEVLGPYSVTFTLSKGNALGAKSIGLKKLLPRKRYSQWLQLKKKYIGKNREIEEALPVTAALVLRSMAFEQAGLTNSDRVWREIYTLAERYHVPVSASHQVDTVVDESARDDERGQRIGVEFLIRTMDNLESDLREARVRANAWATGDIEALKKQAIADQGTQYLYASSWPYLQDSELAALQAEADRRWVNAARSALTRNSTSFAALPISMLLRPDGLLAALRAQGFTVDEPVE